MSYALLVNKSDTLNGAITSGATSGTLTTGSFGSPSGTQVYVIDYDNSNLEVVSASVASTAVTSMTRGLDGTSAVAHSSGAKIASMMTATHYAALIPTTNKVTTSGDVTVNSGTDTDLTGATLTITPSTASTMIVIATFDVSGDTVGNIFSGLLDVDGSNQAETCAFKVNVANSRLCLMQSWRFTLSAAAHTIKLQAARSSGAGTATYSGTNTGFVYMLFQQ